MDKQKLQTMCRLIASYVSSGNDKAFGEALKGITGTDTEWYIEHVANVNYIVSNTLEYVAGQVFFNGNGFEIYIDTQKKTVNGVLGNNVVVATYTMDSLGIDSYLCDRYLEDKKQ